MTVRRVARAGAALVVILLAGSVLAVVGWLVGFVIALATSLPPLTEGIIAYGLGVAGWVLGGVAGLSMLDE